MPGHAQHGRSMLADGGSGVLARAVAARVVDQVRGGALLDSALASALQTLSAQTVGERALIQELAYGTLRWWHRLDALAALVLEKPLRARDADAHALLLVGLYQLMYLRLPAPAAVSTTVSAATVLNKPWCKKLLNACLRRFLREREPLTAELDRDPVSAYSHPAWLIGSIQRAWPGHWQTILKANNERPPLVLRVNLLRNSREEYLERLRESGLPAAALPQTDCGVVLEKPVPVTALPGFNEGAASVQDAAAQLAATLLDLHPKQTVLDACAAPGGKLCHVLERCPALSRVVALDREPARLRLIEQNLARLGLQADIVLGDAGSGASWWGGTPFDRILLDAPCSATGVIRRHPDIKLHRTPGELQRLVQQQTVLLESSWSLLARGGKLLYATCSILPEENEQLLSAFLRRHADAREIVLPLPSAVAVSTGAQILPGPGGMDGFYYACVQKT